MSKYTLGVIVFSESYAREDVYRKRKSVQDCEVSKLLAVLKSSYDVVLLSEGEVRGKKDGRLAANRANQSGCAAVLLAIPCFVNPAVVALTASLINKPIAVCGNMALDSFSQVGTLASVGAMSQAGLRYKQLSSDIENPKWLRTLEVWMRAVNAAEALKGQTFGCVGGRSLGISTGMVDGAQWLREFQLDAEHIDQFELVRRAQSIPEETIQHYEQYILDRYGLVDFCEEKNFSREHLKKMIASYLAMKSIIKDYELDFGGIKCQPELSNGYCLQCLTIQLLNDPYDADGPKEPFACSCEADGNGALSMQILKLLSDGKPTALQDIYYVSEDEMILANCGASASWFSAHADTPEENLSQVHLMPHGFGEAGGAATQFVFAPGIYTFMRLTRDNGQYKMAAFTGMVTQHQREELKKYAEYRPTSFVKHRVDVQNFLKTFGSNHVHCIVGDYLDELQEFCCVKNIPLTIYDRYPTD